MKKLIATILFAVLNTSIIPRVFAQEITYSDLQNKNGRNGISIHLNLGSYNITTLEYKGEEMHEISFSDILIPNDEGLPNLPRLSRLLAIPQGVEINITIKNIEMDTLNNINIAPALRIQAIPETPQMEYVKNKEIYETDNFYPQHIYEISETTEIRGVNTVTIGITPFQFNPVSKSLIVMNNIELEVEFIGGAGNYGEPKYRSPWFDPILRNNLLNYGVIPEIEYSGQNSRNGTGCEYLIIIPNRNDFEQYAEQIKDFRTKQGIYTQIMRLDEMGATNSTEIKSFIHNAYNTWDIPPVAILLMGDHHTNVSIGIPSETMYHPFSGTCISDNSYSDVTGDDLPDIVLGRMAAETAADMAVLVSKFIEYETQPCMDNSYYMNPVTALGWQTDRWFQICSETVGGYWRNQGKTPVRINDIYQGIPGSDWSTAINTNLVVNYFGPNGVGYIPASPAELGGWSGGNSTHVISAINNGAFALQHRDHGYEDGWGKPGFNSSHINQLSNIGKMTYVFTINCSTGKFNYTTPCFGEVFHRHTYQGQNAGCVGFLGPTETSYSFVNDVFAWGMYDLFEPDFLPTFGPSYGSNSGSYIGYSGNWMPAFGNVSGKYFLHFSSWPYNSTRKTITYQMFTAHSDVFLRLFTEVPQAIQVNHASAIIFGDSYFGITASEGTTIALTANGEIFDVATATGSLQMMNIPPTLPVGTDVYVVCTGQNYLRYEAVVPVICYTGLSTVQGIIPPNTTWNTDIHVINDIVIPNGVTLTITSTAKCEKDVTISIQPGGKLIVDSGILTNACPDRLWGGIYVSGNKNSRQLSSYQGSVVLKNDALIENARCAIITASLPEDTNYVNSSGGIIKASNTTFRNNLQAVEFLPYTNTTISGLVIDNASNFTECNFILDDDNFLTSIPNVNFSNHVKLHDVRGVNFYGSVFENLTEDYSGRAIYAQDAGFKVDYSCLPNSGTDIACGTCDSYIPSEFRGFDRAIDVQTTGIQHAVTIDHTHFMNNKTVCVSVRGNNQTKIIRSHFDLTNPKATGVLLNNSSGYKVEENQFYDNQPCFPNCMSNPGIWITNSGTANNMIYRNDFTKLATAIYTTDINGSYIDANSGLEFQCNTFYKNETDIHIYSGRVKSNQGLLSKGAVVKSLQELLSDYEYLQESSNNQSHTANEMWKISTHALQTILNDSILDTDLLKNWYNVIQTPIAKYSLAETHAMLHEFDLADKVLQEIPEMFDYDDNDRKEHNNYFAFHQFKKELYESDRTWYDLTKEEIVTMQEIAESTDGRSSVMAKGVLCFFYDICYPDEKLLERKDEGEKKTERDVEMWRSTSNLEQPEMLGEITLYPNPANSFMTIKSQSVDIDYVEICDLMGRVIMSKNIRSLNGRINLSTLQSSIYMLKIHLNDGEVKVKKIVKN